MPEETFLKERESFYLTLKKNKLPLIDNHVLVYCRSQICALAGPLKNMVLVLVRFEFKATQFMIPLLSDFIPFLKQVIGAFSLFPVNQIKSLLT